jgi:hypothetical protein
MFVKMAKTHIALVLLCQLAVSQAAIRVQSCSFQPYRRGTHIFLRLRGGADANTEACLTGSEHPPPGERLALFPIAERMRAVWELKDLLAARKANSQGQAEENGKTVGTADLKMAEGWLQDPSALVRHEVMYVWVQTHTHIYIHAYVCIYIHAYIHCIHMHTDMHIQAGERCSSSEIQVYF